MKFEILGGDERSVFLAERLKAAGNGVYCFAMENAEVGAAEKTDEVISADCYILPVPAEDGCSGLLNGKFSAKRHELSSLTELMPRSSLVIGGRLPRSVKDAARERELCAVDLMSRQDFTVGNAAITAEAAVSLLMERLDTTLSGSGILVSGYGRIGRLLSAKLSALGANVSVLSRSAQSREMAKALGMSALSPSDTEALGGIEAAVNTAPAPFPCRLSCFSRDCLLVELASAPGGFDMSEALRLNMSCIAAPGLPGKYAPRSAAAVMENAVKNIVREYGKR